MADSGEDVCLGEPGLHADAAIIDLTFIQDEQRRVQVADCMYLVWDNVEGAPRPDGLRWDHICETIPDREYGTLIKRIAAFLGTGHRIVVDDPVTIEGSLLCLGCKRHGFVREGRWVDA